MLMPGDVVVALVTYSDMIGAKVRPALVLSSAEFNMETNQIVVAAISTKLAKDRFDIVIEKWKEAGLRLPSKVRIGKLVTVDARLGKKIGNLVPEESTKVITLVKTVIAQPESMAGSD